MEQYELMENSILKNLQEFSEFVVEDLHIDNYYDLTTLITNLWNLRAKLMKKDIKLYFDIRKEIENGI